MLLFPHPGMGGISVFVVKVILPSCCLARVTMFLYVCSSHRDRWIRVAVRSLRNVKPLLTPLVNYYQATNYFSQSYLIHMWVIY